MLSPIYRLRLCLAVTLPLFAALVFWSGESWALLWADVPLGLLVYLVHVSGWPGEYWFGDRSEHLLFMLALSLYIAVVCLAFACFWGVSLGLVLGLVGAWRMQTNQTSRQDGRHDNNEDGLCTGR